MCVLFPLFVSRQQLPLCFNSVIARSVAVGYSYSVKCLNLNIYSFIDGPQLDSSCISFEHNLKVFCILIVICHRPIIPCSRCQVGRPGCVSQTLTVLASWSSCRFWCHYGFPISYSLTLSVNDDPCHRF